MKPASSTKLAHRQVAQVPAGLRGAGEAQVLARWRRFGREGRGFTSSGAWRSAVQGGQVERVVRAEGSAATRSGAAQALRASDWPSASRRPVVCSGPAGLEPAALPPARAGRLGAQQRPVPVAADAQGQAGVMRAAVHGQFACE